LVGEQCRWNGKSKLIPEIKTLYEQWQAIPICPEMLAGLWVPRVPCEGGREQVIGKDGKDYTELFRSGAKKALGIAQKNGIHKAILKSKSPSCWYEYIYDKTFSSTVEKGDGVTAYLLKQNGIEILNEHDYLGK
jgi:uncharacterized protein YbbK (DUF523 family)